MDKIKIKSDGKLFIYKKKEFKFLLMQNRLPIEIFKFISSVSAKKILNKPCRTLRDRFKQFIKDNNLKAFYDNCCICGFYRRIELCHLIPHSEGGFYTLDNIIPLCPNHHKCLDGNILYDEEFTQIQEFLWKIITYLIPFYFECLAEKRFFNKNHKFFY